jgi:hypothetical protein
MSDGNVPHLRTLYGHQSKGKGYQRYTWMRWPRCWRIPAYNAGINEKWLLTGSYDGWLGGALKRGSDGYADCSGVLFHMDVISMCSPVTYRPTRHFIAKVREMFQVYFLRTRWAYLQYLISCIILCLVVTRFFYLLSKIVIESILKICIDENKREYYFRKINRCWLIHWLIFKECILLCFLYFFILFRLNTTTLYCNIWIHIKRNSIVYE